MKKKIEKYLSKIFKILGSLKLAVFVILSLAAITAIGTFYESYYSTYVAKKLIYESVWMYTVMGLLIVNLVFSAVERFPWKRRHTGFLLAHAGIIIIILGSYVTQKAGLDASLALSIGEKSRFVGLPYERVLAFYETEDGTNYRRRGQSPINFTRSKPSTNHPYIIQENPHISIVDYWPYADRKSTIVPTSSQKDGPALQFQLFNNTVNVSQRLIRETAPASIDLGPMKIVLADSDYKAGSGNEIVVTPHKDPKKFNYFLFKKQEPTKNNTEHQSSERIFTKGISQEGNEIQTEWMGLKFKVLSYFPSAQEKITYSQRDKPLDSSVPVLHVKFKDDVHTLGLNSILKLFDEETAYVLAYNNKRVNLGFPMELKSFQVKRYPGSQKAMSYESVLITPDGKETLVSMNEPLKHKGYTFYQASFEEDEWGNPVASIFTVNYDPGRWIKYLGSLLLISGILVLFYMKGYFGRKTVIS